MVATGMGAPAAFGAVSPTHLEFGDVPWGTVRTPVKTVSISGGEHRVKSILAQARFPLVQSDCEYWVDTSCTIGVAPHHPAPGAATAGRVTDRLTVTYTNGQSEYIWVSATFLPQPPAPPPSTWLAVGDVTVTEGNAGTTTATLSITRSGDTTGASSVKWNTANSTATSAGNDYVAVPLTTLNFAPGETTKTVSVTVKGDTTEEANEPFSVRLSSPTGAVLSDDTGTVTIVDDDETYLAAGDASVTEGNSGTRVADFTITRSGGTANASSVRWVTVNGTASSASDYVAVPSTTVSFAAGDTTKTVSVT